MDSQIMMRKVAELKPYKNNPRKNDKAVDAVAASIKAFGFKQPIVIDVNDEVLAGDTRLKAAKKNGLDEVPCIVASDLTPEQVKAYRLADNKVGELAEWDWNLLPVEMDGLTGFDMTEFGFEENEADVNEFGENFTLPSGEKGEMKVMTFTLHKAQAELINAALESVGECGECFGNTNKKGNALYEVIKEWERLRK